MSLARLMCAPHEFCFVFAEYLTDDRPLVAMMPITIARVNMMDELAAATSERVRLPWM